MSEATTPPATPAAPAAETPPSDSAPLGEGGKKALDAERAARKAAEDSAKQLQAQIEALNAEKLSDLEKAQKAAKDAQDVAAKATAEALRFRVASDEGIPANVAEVLLTAADEAGMRQQAAIYKDGRTDGPRPDPTQGGMGGTAAKSKGDQFADFANSFFTR